MKIGMLGVGFPNFRHDIGNEYYQAIRKQWQQKDGVTVAGPVSIGIEEKKILTDIKNLAKEEIDALILVCATYSFGSILSEVVRRFPKTPLLLWGFEEPMLEGSVELPLNSLCGLNMYASFLNRWDHPFSYVYGGVESEAVWKQAETFLQAMRAKSALARAKFCVVGGRVPGFYLSEVNELKFRQVIGPEIDRKDLSEVMARMRAFTDEEVSAASKRLLKPIDTITAGEGNVAQTIRLTLALKMIAEEEGITGYAIKCWPEFQSILGISACGAVALLNDAGIMTACEGDVTALATMLTQKVWSNSPCFLADWVNINTAGDAKMWHCGPAAPSLAAQGIPVKLTDHPTIRQGMGTAMEFTLKTGVVTLMKLSEGKEGYRMLLESGSAIEPDRTLFANQMDVRFTQDANEVLKRVMEHGFEHHYVLAYGKFEEETRELCKWLDVDVIGGQV